MVVQDGENVFFAETGGNGEGLFVGCFGGVKDFGVVSWCVDVRVGERKRLAYRSSWSLYHLFLVIM